MMPKKETKKLIAAVWAISLVLFYHSKEYAIRPGFDKAFIIDLVFFIIYILYNFMSIIQKSHITLVEGNYYYLRVNTGEEYIIKSSKESSPYSYYSHAIKLSNITTVLKKSWVVSYDQLDEVRAATRSEIHKLEYVISRFPFINNPTKDYTPSNADDFEPGWYYLRDTTLYFTSKTCAKGVINDKWLEFTDFKTFGQGYQKLPKERRINDMLLAWAKEKYIYQQPFFIPLNGVRALKVTNPKALRMSHDGKRIWHEGNLIYEELKWAKIMEDPIDIDETLIQAHVNKIKNPCDEIGVGTDIIEGVMRDCSKLSIKLPNLVPAHSIPAYEVRDWEEETFDAFPKLEEII